MLCGSSPAAWRSSYESAIQYLDTSQRHLSGEMLTATLQVAQILQIAHLLESGVWISSTRSMVPSGLFPNSYLVSTSRRPLSRASAWPKANKSKHRWCTCNHAALCSRRLLTSAGVNSAYATHLLPFARTHQAPIDDFLGTNWSIMIISFCRWCQDARMQPILHMSTLLHKLMVQLPCCPTDASTSSHLTQCR